MRTLALSLALAVALVTVPYQSRAQAATEFVVWPAQYSYGTPSGAFTWNSTVLGLRFTNRIAPHFGFGAGLYYGSVANLALAGSGLGGFTGSTLAGDLSLRFGTSIGLLDLGAYGGYQAFGMAANGSTPSDRILLQTSGLRTGADIRFHLASGLVLRGGVTILPSLNSSENLSLSSPPTAAQFNGTGNGTEYELGLGYSLTDFSAFVGYRSGNYQTNWSGDGSTSTTFSGYVFSLESRF
jgi:hypothetical protein